MDPVRDFVWDQASKGYVQVTQGGIVRSFDEREHLKGPIRVRRGPRWDEGDLNREEEEEQVGVGREGALEG